MTPLDWIGKRAVLTHHEHVPFHLLKPEPEGAVGDRASPNLLVEGDNLIALKALLPYYAKQAKLIYIDPPYNTGNERWVYNDAVNSPEMKEWLGKIVGGEAEDLSRHDKWLTMMYPRMKLLKKLLREDGAIFVSIDDNEVHRLRCLMDEVFGPNNFVASIIWQKRTSPDARLNLGPAHDYIIVYARRLEAFKATMHLIPLSPARAKDFKNLDNDPRGVWASVDLSGQEGHATPDQFYVVRTPSGKEYKPPPGRCWALAERTFYDLRSDNRIWFGKNGNSRPRVKRFLSEVEGTTTWTWWPNEEVGHNQEATKELADIIGSANFETPKPLRLIRRIIQLASDPDSLIIDAFAGSGTTGHAVLAQNVADGGNRSFVLVEMDSAVATNVTRPRLKKAVEGYVGAKSGAEVAGLGSGFRVCALGEPLFDQFGSIRDSVKFSELAQHVFFTETRTPLSRTANGKSPLLGVHDGTAVYLLYNGVLGDDRSDAGNILTQAVLANLPPHSGQKVVYGEGCRLGENRLKRERIVFKQTPYDLRVG